MGTVSENMDDRNKRILKINHDVNNQLGVALGYLDLLLESNPQLNDMSYGKLSFQGLLRARELCVELAMSCDDNDITNEINSNTSKLSVIHAQNFFTKISKPGFEELKKRYDIEISAEYSLLDEDKYINVDPLAIKSLRENIVSNSVHAGATKVTASFIMHEYGLIVTFSDNGKGMTPSEVDKLILKKHGDGIIHGLGTASILDTINDYGYTVTYSSEIGKGTQIRILAPYFEK